MRRNQTTGLGDWVFSLDEAIGIKRLENSGRTNMLTTKVAPKGLH